jgi:hypothetical protein
MISQIIVKGGRFFKAADGSDVQMSKSQSRGARVQLNITSQKK